MPAAKRGSIPRDFMRRMPEPHAYFARALPDMTEPDADGWAEADCPLPYSRVKHRVRIDVRRGRFSCLVCHRRGDVLDFHLQNTGKRFRDAVLELIEGNSP